MSYVHNNGKAERIWERRDDRALLFVHDPESCILPDGTEWDPPYRTVVIHNPPHREYNLEQELSATPHALAEWRKSE